MTEETLTKGERTRQAVLDAAYELFLNQGYSATSMRQIAVQAGIALGGIYNHFASKDEIFQELIIVKHPYVQIFPLLRNVPGDTAEEFLLNATKIIQKEIGQRPDFMKLLFIELVEFSGKHFAKLAELILPQAQQIIIRFASPESGARPLSPLVMVRIFLGSFVGFYATSLIMSDPGLPAEIRNVQLEDFMDVFMHGILKPKI